eukprot:TRINITY_DN3072_c0_g1_i11.p1 TRINITY_DN3072_c0_g1~~TRINITY_DN3072_c0_g1_i11.p1  ORF type:complete len:270 (+),score=55.53 TRINITY_DN3072_c0_g1_i11:229-1038(+)
MDQVQIQHVGMYGQPTEVGITGRVAYMDRSQAAFVGPPLNVGPPSLNAGASGARGFRGTPDNAKTKMCLRWSAGDCRFGDRCNFAHGEHELRQPPKKDINVMLPQQRYIGGQQAAAAAAAMLGGVRSPFVPLNSVPGPVFMMNPQQMMTMSGGTFPTLANHPTAVPMRTHSVETAGTSAISFNSASPIPTNISSPTKYSPTMLNAKDKPADMAMDAWMAKGCPVPGSNGWCKYTTPDGQDYYHNFQSNVTQWDVPLDYYQTPPPPTHNQ